jgi:hypothetical protein
VSDKFELVTKGYSEIFPSIEDALIASKKLLARLRIIRVSDGVVMAWRGPWKEDGQSDSWVNPHEVESEEKSNNP